MHVVGIDSGLTIGMAHLVRGGTAEVLEFSSPVQAWDWMSVVYVTYDPYTRVAVEDFVGSGPRSAEITATIKQVGFFQHGLELKGWRHDMQDPQRRKAFLREAAELLGLPGPVGTGHPMVHKQDALAHALRCAHEHRKEGG